MVENSSTNFMNAYPRRMLSTVCVIYLVFVIYGSLVPLDLHPVALDVAWQLYLNIPYLALDIGSRADWVANILLFVPLAFFLLGTLWSQTYRHVQWLGTCLVPLVLMGLAAGIEYIQIFFPPRTVSINDIVAESIGAGVGVLAWRLWNRKFLEWHKRLWAARHADVLIDQLVIGYLAGLFFYSVMPLDLTLSPVELFHKWRDGRIVLMPFAVLRGDIAEAMYELSTDVLIWVPFAVWVEKKWSPSTLYQLAWLTGVATLLEFLQLFVYSRVTDINDIFAAGIAGLAVSILARSNAGRVKQRGSVIAYRSSIFVAGFIAWSAFLMMVFWYPYDFSMAGIEVSSRVEGLFEVPFKSYYFGTEYRALTEVLQRMLLFAPFGIVVVLLAQGDAGRFCNICAFLLFAAIAGIAFIIEVGQIWLPAKFPNLTDCLLEITGAWLAFMFAKKYLKLRDNSLLEGSPVGIITSNEASMIGFSLAKGGEVGGNSNSPEPVPGNRAQPPRFYNAKTTGRAVPMADTNLFRLILPGAILLAIIGQMALHSPIVPYNFRELLGEDSFISLLVFLCAVYWVVGLPVLAVDRWTGREWGGCVYPLFILGHGMIAWALLALAVSRESMDDVVGSPILGWIPPFEQFGRFTALMIPVSWSLCLAAIWALPKAPGQRLERPFRLLLAGAYLLPISYWVVVKWAATDNLTELLSEGGTPGAYLWIVVFLGVLYGHSSYAAAIWGSGRHKLFGLYSLGLIGTALIGYMLLSQGLEEMLFKYGKVFSAMQFLLSADREHYVSGSALFMRYIGGYLAIGFVIMIIQLPFWRSVLGPRPSSTGQPHS